MHELNSVPQPNDIDDHTTERAVGDRIEPALCRRALHPDPKVTSISLLSNSEIEFMSRRDLEYLMTMMYEFFGQSPRILELQCLSADELVQRILSMRGTMRSAVDSFASGAGYAAYFYDSEHTHNHKDGETLEMN